MPLIEPFSQKEVSNLRQGLSSTLSPLAPPFTVKRNPANSSTNFSQIVEPTFNDYFSSMSGSLDTWLHLHPPTASDGLVSGQTLAASSISDLPPPGFSRALDDSTYLPGSYGHSRASTDASFCNKPVFSDDPYRVLPLPAAARVSDGASYPSDSYNPSDSHGYAELPVKADLGGKGDVPGDPYSVRPLIKSSSLPEYFDYPSEYGYYCVGVVPDGSCAGGAFKESLCAYESSNTWGSFQGVELGQENKVNDVEESGQRFLPEIKMFGPDLEFTQQREYPPQPRGASPSEDTSITSAIKHDGSFLRHTQSSSQIDFKYVHDLSAETLDMNAQSLLAGTSGTTSPSPCTPPPSNILPSTLGRTFMNLDSVHPNGCFIQQSSSPRDSTFVYPGTSCYPFVQAFQPLFNEDLSSNGPVVSEDANYGSFFPMDPFRHINDPNVDFSSAGKKSRNKFSMTTDSPYNFVGIHDASSNGNNIHLQPVDDTFSSHQDGVNYVSDVRSVENTERTLPNSNLSNLLVSEQVVDDSAVLVENLCEKNDQLISAVDSPCWKGVPTFWHSPFKGTDDDSLPHCLKAHERCDEPVHLRVGIFSPSKASSQTLTQSSWTNNDFVNTSSPLNVDTDTLLYADGDEMTSGPCHNYADNIFKATHTVMEPCIASSCVQEHEPKISSSHSTKQEPGPASSGKPTISATTEAYCSSHIKTANQDGVSDFLSQPIGHTQSSKCTGTSASTDIQENLNGLSENSSEYVPEIIDAHLLIRKIHNFSTLLLSRSYTDGNILKENSCDVLRLVISNLEQLTRKHEEHKYESWSPWKGPYMRSTGADPWKAAGFNGSECIPVDLIYSHQKESSSNGRPVRGNSIPKKMASPCSASIAGDLHFDKESVVRQARDVLLRNNHNNEGEDHSHIQVYKTLWLEAEAALCAMKYEATLARMEMEVLKVKQNQLVPSDLKGSPQAMPRVDDGGNIQKLHEPKSSPSDCADLESSVIGRFKILQERVEKLSKLEEPPVFPDAKDYTKPQIENAESENHKPNIDAPGAVDAITSFYSEEIRNTNNPGKERYDRIGIVNQNLHEREALLSDSDHIDSSVAARFQILKHRSQKSDHLGGSTSLQNSIDIRTVDPNQRTEGALLQAVPGVNLPFRGVQKWLDLVDAEPGSVPLQSSGNSHGRIDTQLSGSYVFPPGNVHGMDPLAWEKLETQGSFCPYGSDVSGTLTSPSLSGGILPFKNGIAERFNRANNGGAAIRGEISSQTDSTYGWEHVLKEEIAF